MYAGKKAFIRGKNEYDTAQHKAHVAAVDNDLSPYLKQHPEDAEELQKALATIRKFESKMDEENQTEKQGQGAQINQFLVKPRIHCKYIYYLHKFKFTIETRIKTYEEG